MKIIPILKRTFVLSIFMMLIFSCQKDDTVKTENDSQQTSEKKQKIVNASDIPKVMEFLKTKTNNQLTFELGILSEDGIHGRQAEPDLIITEAETENIIALTNAAGITNYTFKLQLDNAPVFQNEISFFNLIVKEVNTDEEFYGYIQEYRMDKTWYRNNGPDLNFSFYDGKMVIYTLEGLYVSALNINQGTINHAHYKSPCPDEGNPSGGGGSGEPGGPIESPPGGSGGSGGGSGGSGGGSGGYDISVDVVCGCPPAHPGGNGSPGCNCTMANIPVNIHLGQKTMGGWIINQLKSHCPPLQDAPITCHDIYDDPCTLGCNLDGTCFEENEEIPIYPPPFNIALMMDLEEFLNQGLTQEQKNWIHANYANYDFAFQILDMLQNNIINGIQAQNWFFGNVPDFEIDLNINPLLITYDSTLSQQPLPTMQEFINNFPKLGTSGNYTQMPSTDVYYLVGGSLWNSHQSNPAVYNNACALRGSRGLLYSGIEIPVLNYPNVGQRTQKGGDQLNYILDAVSFNKFMNNKFGMPTHNLEGTAANDAVQVSNLLNGIYVIINNNHNQAGYSGHVDIIINGICIGGAYTTPNGGVKKISIWELE